MPLPYARPGVSVIIAARNAAATVGACLESIEAQTIPGWEAIVVDDGSADGTPGRVAEFCQRDTRIRLLRQSPRGVSRARNEGAGLAQYDRLLFLDPDDSIVPSALESFTDMLREDPQADAVHSGWQRVLPGGAVLTPEYFNQENDLFEVFAGRCAFPLHACVIRRSSVMEVGGFDHDFDLCEDWDLWQRIARTGARFRSLRAPLSRHHLRDGSPPSHAPQDWFAAGYRIIRTGHAEDPRVRSAYHVRGLPPSRMPWAKLTFLSWVAGQLIAAGVEPHDLLETAQGETCDALTPHVIAENLFVAATRTAPVRLSRVDFLKDFLTRSVGFLQRLEEQSGTPALEIRTGRHLEGMFQSFLFDAGALKQPLLIGRTLGASVEVTRPIADLAAPKGADRLCCTVTMEGAPLGTLYLPISDPGTVPDWLLKDAIAGKFAWPILLRFFEHNMATKIEVISSSEGTEARRGDTRLAAGLPQACSYGTVISHIGWALFLQEIWGIPEWREHRFYEQGQSPIPAPAAYPPAARTSAPDTTLTVEVSSPLPPSVSTPDGQAHVVICVGGVPLDRFAVKSEVGRITAQQIRVAVNAAADMEICRAAVREGLIGTPFGGTRPLRERLAQAAAKPDSAHDARASSALRVGRAAGPIGTSISRQALLPVATAQIIRELAARNGQALSEPADIRCVAYAPDLLGTTSERPWRVAPPIAVGGEDAVGRADYDDAGDFTVVFSAGANPSDQAAYEKQKLEQTLSLLPPGRIPKALELADEEDRLAARLAERVDQLVVADKSESSSARHAARFAARPNIECLRLDLVADAIPGRFNLITCGAALANVTDETGLRAAADKIADALEPGGHFILSRANVSADDPQQPDSTPGVASGATTIDETLEAGGRLHLVRELRAARYCIQVFQKEQPGLLAGLARRIRHDARHHPVVETVDPSVPDVEIQAPFGRDTRADTGMTTDWLPILLYHRVSPKTADPMQAELCIAPQAFEAQLDRLAEAGFRSIDLEEWRLAITARRPLEGRAVIFTFDGGYEDFAEYAWPLLKRYGFSAEVFLVAGQIGSTDERHTGRRTPVPLMGWDEIRRLQEQGVRFGSHTLRNPLLTSLSPADVVEEAVRSRLILERGLGAPVTSVAFPYGDTDPAVEHLFGACGYLYGLTAGSRASGMGDPILSLPRITIRRSDGSEEFARKLGV